jgi:hypothetical protein
MQIHTIAAARGLGVYQLLDTLSVHHIQVLENRYDELGPDYALLEGPGVSDEDEVALIVTPPTELFGCWWFDESACRGDDCHCGPVTLLEVLTHSTEAARPGIVAAHVAHLANLWDHYWSGEALLSATSGQIGSACPECLLSGGAHIDDLGDAAQQLSGELGEAISAYHSLITLGPPRWI